MGFWHTGYIEHHEDAGLGDNWQPAPTVYRCVHCSLQFEMEDELRKHRFETHPYTQPSLFFRGIELGASPVYVRRKIKPSEIFLATCNRAYLNGEAISVGDLPTRLSHIRSDRVTIELSNAGASASYDIHFQIADARDLERVDEAFQRLAKCGVLSISSLDDFIIQCRPFATAAPYLDGIAHYLYGVLAKERAPDSTVPHDKYPDRFNAAAAALADYERPLANLIRALVAFNFNHFQEAATLAPAGRLKTAALGFSDSVGGAGWSPVAARTIKANCPEDLLTDSETHQILAWTEAPAKTLVRETERIELLANGEASSFSKIKLKILLIAALEAGGESTRARKTARELLIYQATAPMAERIIDRTTATEGK